MNFNDIDKTFNTLGLTVKHHKEVETLTHKINAFAAQEKKVADIAAQLVAASVDDWDSVLADYVQQKNIADALEIARKDGVVNTMAGARQGSVDRNLDHYLNQIDLADTLQVYRDAVTGLGHYVEDGEQAALNGVGNHFADRVNIERQFRALMKCMERFSGSGVAPDNRERALSILVKPLDSLGNVPPKLTVLSTADERDARAATIDRHNLAKRVKDAANDSDFFIKLVRGDFNSGNDVFELSFPDSATEYRHRLSQWEQVWQNAQRSNAPIRPRSAA